MTALTSDVSLPQTKRRDRSRIHVLSRVIIVGLVLTSIGSLFWQPQGILQTVVDILVRAHLMFLCTVMAHEASHGHLGRSKAANMWWGRISLIPATVPYVNFRKTHHLHHAHTNIPEKDPDHFIKPNHWWEVPFRSVALPHYWVLFLTKNKRLKRADWIEWALHYIVLGAVYGTVLYVMGPARLAMGMIPSLLIVSIFLWYLFAVKTHEGFSTGHEVLRSHNYYGMIVYWFTLGLSMHRAHHLYPYLSWVELRDYVESAPGPWYRRFLFSRDIKTSL